MPNIVKTNKVYDIGRRFLYYCFEIKSILFEQRNLSKLY